MVFNQETGGMATFTEEEQAAIDEAVAAGKVRRFKAGCNLNYSERARHLAHQKRAAAKAVAAWQLKLRKSDLDPAAVVETSHAH